MEPERELRAIVVPMARPAVRPDSPSVAAAFPGDGHFSVADLLRVAAARGASAVYVVAQSPPMARSDGEITALEIGSGAPLTESDVNRLVLELAPSAARDAWQRAAVAEWMCDVADVGPVRCVTFRDHRGPGVLFRLVPPRATLADQLALTPEIRALCTQADGLVIVTGPRASGKSTLLSAFIDLINRTSSDHVITIESQIAFAHESRRSFVSQREVRGDSDAVVSAIRAALREDPDVLLIEDLRSPEVASVAFEAAESGRLVFGALPAASTVAAVTRLLEMFPHDRRSQAQAALAGTLRAVVGQVLLRRSKGGRIAAREILVNTPAIAALLEEGKTAPLPLAMEGGRRHGMMPLNDALASFVRDGTVHITEAYLKAFDKEGLLATLERQVGDTGLAERLA
jgi:twitching motility protein PilT